MNICLTAILLCSAALAPAQTVCVGTTEQCRNMQEKTCADEPALANLTLSRSTEVTGLTADETGAPFGEGVAVQLRDVATGNVVSSGAPDARGIFALGFVTAGDYRVIIVRVRNGRIERLAGFTQPASLHCVGSNSCQIKVVPKVHGSDNTDFCGPK